MKKYILIYQESEQFDYCNTRMERFDNEAALSAYACKLLLKHNPDGMRISILFSGRVSEEYDYKPIDIVTKYKQVSK
jgi:hypothetical protein